MKTTSCTMVALLMILMQACSSNAIIQTPQVPPLPSVNAVWSGIAYSSPPLKYYLGESAPGNTIDCNITYSIIGDKYVFQATTAKDTANISISRYYVGTNVDSINLMINPGIDSSSVSVIYNCSWLHQRKWFCRGSRPQGDFCQITSTNPVHVAIFVLIDWRKNNVGKGIREFIQEEDVRRLDSVIQSMPEASCVKQ